MATSAPVIAHCSFCTKPSTAVKRLVAGAGVYICSGCVALCASILESLDPASPDPVRVPEWEHLGDDEMLAHTAGIAATAGRVDASLRAWVAELRARGVTWTRIGDTLGVTRQSAWERFSGAD
jgi:hypothetical protein